jgi:hypothetical protein
MDDAGRVMVVGGVRHLADNDIPPSGDLPPADAAKPAPAKTPPAKP